MSDETAKDNGLAARAREAMKRLVDDVVDGRLADESLDVLGKIILQIILVGNTEMELPTRLFYSLRVDGKPIDQLDLGHGVYVVRVPDSGTAFLGISDGRQGSTFNVSNKGWDAVLRDPNGQEKGRVSLVDKYTTSGSIQT